eukprot:scaffold154033_cov37-Tisochrysis_lutea.AAC.2
MCHNTLAKTGMQRRKPMRRRCLEHSRSRGWHLILRGKAHGRRGFASGAMSERRVAQLHVMSRSCQPPAGHRAQHLGDGRGAARKEGAARIMLRRRQLERGEGGKHNIAPLRCVAP